MIKLGKLTGSKIILTMGEEIRIFIIMCYEANV